MEDVKVYMVVNLDIKDKDKVAKQLLKSVQDEVYGWVFK